MFGAGGTGTSTISASVKDDWNRVKSGGVVLSDDARGCTSSSLLMDLSLEYESPPSKVSFARSSTHSFPGRLQGLFIPNLTFPSRE